MPLHIPPEPDTAPPHGGEGRNRDGKDFMWMLCYKEPDNNQHKPSYWTVITSMNLFQAAAKCLTLRVCQAKMCWELFYDPFHWWKQGGGKSCVKIQEEEAHAVKRQLHSHPNCDLLFVFFLCLLFVLHPCGVQWEANQNGTSFSVDAIKFWISFQDN